MLFPVVALVATVSASTITPRVGCVDPVVRKEWRSLSDDERNSYIKAVHCMAEKPSKLGLDTTVYDDFPWVHNALNNNIHFVANFLPWHRYFVHVYETELKACGYTGNAAYWDWTLDSDNPSKSTIWDAITGIGGNGDPNTPVNAGNLVGQCVTDGPFKDLKPSYVTETFVPHCIRRSFNNGTEQIGNMLSEAYTPESVAEINELGDYDNFRQKLEGTPHGAIHSAVGGEMSPATSPNDPLFFLHHTQIDRLWYLWQQGDAEKRNTDYSGNKTQWNVGEPAPVQASVDDLMPMLKLADDLPVKDVMTTKNDLLCYTY